MRSSKRTKAHGQAIVPANVPNIVSELHCLAALGGVPRAAKSEPGAERPFIWQQQREQIALFRFCGDSARS